VSSCIAGVVARLQVNTGELSYNTAGILLCGQHRELHLLKKYIELLHGNITREIMNIDNDVIMTIMTS